MRICADYGQWALPEPLHSLCDFSTATLAITAASIGMVVRGVPASVTKALDLWMSNDKNFAAQRIELDSSKVRELKLHGHDADLAVPVPSPASLHWQPAIETGPFFFSLFKTSQIASAMASNTQAFAGWVNFLRLNCWYQSCAFRFLFISSSDPPCTPGVVFSRMLSL
jgi:hypothetical protein